MKKMVSLVIVLFANYNICFGQKATNYASGIEGTKVLIKNFYRSPPDCGFLKNISIYEAEVIDSLSILQGKKILICVQCKGETYPMVRGNRFIVNLSSGYVEPNGAYNFTDYTDEELKGIKKYNILSLQEYSSTQPDSVDVFFIGNIPGEKFKVFWDGKLLTTIKGNRSYKYRFKIPRDSMWQDKDYTNKFSVYRKPTLGLRYREVGTFNPNYEPKKYLVIWRNPKLKNRAAIQTNWSNREP